MNQKATARTGFVFCTLVIVGLVVAHTRLWLFAEFAEGNHVAQDLHQAGIHPSGTDRAVGFVLGGIPVVFFILCLLPLARAFRMQPASEPRSGEAVGELIQSSSRYAVAAVVGLLVYPPILSSALSTLGSLDTPMIIVSAAPHVMALGICALLFRLLTGSLVPPKGPGPRSGQANRGT